MKKTITLIRYFNLFEICLWLGSVITVALSFFAFGGDNAMLVIASLVGVTSLIFNAKGNPIGQALMVVFSILYGIISFDLAYYGEMITYVGMTMPMAVLALVSWVRNPYNGQRSQVKIDTVSKKEYAFMTVSSLIVTAIFFFILKYFNTANLLPSTISVTTSYVAVYLTFKRSKFYALGYAANDVVLIILWSLAAITDISYISVVICFCAFLVNDIYGFISWNKMESQQKNGTTNENDIAN